jgi:hypothetical protein
MGIILLGVLVALLFIVVIIATFDVSTETKKEKKKKEKSYDRYDNEHRWNNNQKKFEKILNLLIKDFNNNPYSYKYRTTTINRSIHFTYNFNNGYKLNLIDEYLFLSNKNGEEINSFNLDSIQVIEFYRLINKIIDRTESHRTHQTESDKSRTKSEPKVESTGNTKLDKILEKIKLREEQLRKMRSNDTERSALENELNTYKNIANKMKSKI